MSNNYKKGRFMSWLGTDFERYDTENEVKSEFYETVLYEVPSGLADMQKCVCVGIVSNIEDAKKLITRKAVDSGMTYVKVVTKAVPKTIQDIEQRMRKEEQKLNDYLLKNNCYDRKSATIGCKGCGSSLSTKHMAAKKLNKCPLCGTELRNDTVLKTIETYRVNIDKYKKQYDIAVHKSRKSTVFFYGKGRYYLG